MALSAAYAACTTVICLEVVVIFGLLAFLFKKSDDAGQFFKSLKIFKINIFQGLIWSQMLKM